MADFREKFGSYQASKKVLFWSCAGTAVLTMVIGFTWGGWVTGGSAIELAENTSEAAVASLAADVCFTRFMAAPDLQANLTAFNEESTYARAKYIDGGGWTTLGGQEKPISGAAKLCAEQLAEADIPTPVAEAPLAPSSTMPVADAETAAN
ncbi:hypothetical protein [Devosia sp. A449]